MTDSSWLGSAGRGSAIVAVLAFGVIAGGAILSYERPATAHDGHNHGAGEGHDDKDDGHAHEPAGGDDHKHGADEAKDHSHAKGDDPAHDEGDHRKTIQLTAEQRDNAKLTVETAGAGMIKQSLTVNGIILPNEEKTVAVLPRFGGVVRAVTKRLGEPVKKGEVVARIESNESLTQYEILAPINGVVIERNGTLGEFASTDKRLMVISDLSDVWVDLRIYSQDFNKLKVGQGVDIDLPGHDEPHTAKISYLSPIGMTDTQSMLARAVVDNADGGFLPGLFVTGHVVISERPAQVAVKETSVQYIDNKAVVFVETDGGFETRQVELGLKDETMIEVVSGVAAGDKVVTGNSFLLKAELGKGEAEHVH